jgi:hypothetical protein
MNRVDEYFLSLSLVAGRGWPKSAWQCVGSRHSKQALVAGRWKSPICILFFVVRECCLNHVDEYFLSLALGAGRARSYQLDNAKVSGIATNSLSLAVEVANLHSAVWECCLDKNGEGEQ